VASLLDALPLAAGGGELLGVLRTTGRAARAPWRAPGATSRPRWHCKHPSGGAGGRRLAPAADLDASVHHAAVPRL